MVCVHDGILQCVAGRVRRQQLLIRPRRRLLHNVLFMLLELACDLAYLVLQRVVCLRMQQDARLGVRHEHNLALFDRGQLLRAVPQPATHRDRAAFLYKPRRRRHNRMYLFNLLGLGDLARLLLPRHEIVERSLLVVLRLQTQHLVLQRVPLKH